MGRGFVILCQTEVDDLKKLLWGLLIVLLVGCSTSEANSEKDSLTIKPEELSKEEEELIRHTGIDFIEFFELNGKLKQTDELKYSFVVYKNGKYERDLIRSFGAMEDTYEQERLSFSLKTIEEEAAFSIGFNSGNATSGYDIPNTINAWSFARNIHEEYTLQKGKPVYAAYWLGTSKNSLRSVGSENPTEVPESVKEAELAVLFKVELIDKEDR